MKTSFVKILRPAWDNSCDCTNGGVSGRVNSATLFSDCSVEEAVKYCQEHNMRPEDHLIFVPRTLWGEDHSIVEPLVRPSKESGKVVGPMFGGNYVSQCGSDPGYPHLRGWAANQTFPIPIHDRFETKEDCEILSR